MSDTYKYRVTAEMKPVTYCITADTIVVRKDGSLAVIPSGTLITAPVPQPPYTIDVIE
jgi:hypothetical protein